MTSFVLELFFHFITGESLFGRFYICMYVGEECVQYVGYYTLLYYFIELNAIVLCGYQKFSVAHAHVHTYTVGEG